MQATNNKRLISTNLLKFYDHISTSKVMISHTDLPSYFILCVLDLPRFQSFPDGRVCDVRRLLGGNSADDLQEVK